MCVCVWGGGGGGGGGGDKHTCVIIFCPEVIHLPLQHFKSQFLLSKNIPSTAGTIQRASLDAAANG